MITKVNTLKIQILIFMGIFYCLYFVCSICTDNVVNDKIAFHFIFDFYQVVLKKILLSANHRNLTGDLWIERILFHYYDPSNR